LTHGIQKLRYLIPYASSVVDGRIYVMGGQDEFNDPMNLALVQIYDPATDKWSFGSPMPEVVWQAAAAATSGIWAPKRIYLIGGIPEKSIDGTNLNQIYNPATDSWTAGSPMPTARSDLQVVALNDRLYAMGGLPFFNMQGAWSSENEEYTPIGYGTPEPTSSPLPSPNPTLTPSPSPSSSQTNSVSANFMLIAFVVLTITLSAGLLIYFKKRQRSKSL
jgi:N-acetylneuraminic acid mutarotase